MTTTEIYTLWGVAALGVTLAVGSVYAVWARSGLPPSQKWGVTAWIAACWVFFEMFVRSLFR